MPRPGDELGGRYRLIAELGAGAYGVVFRARDLETRGEVAVKILKQVSSAELAIRFEREALAMARLRGTSALSVHAFGHTPAGAPYIVMELLRGIDLEAFLEQAESQGGRLKPRAMLSLLCPVARTLEAAHQRGIVHRDLKPSNIFVLDGRVGRGVRLMDFGLVKLLDADSLTAEGMVAGTPSYIAPEAWSGDPRTLDHRIDVYALGVLVFRCLSGRVPHATNSLLELCRWAQTGARPSLRALRKSLPADIDGWTERALAIDPARRFQDVQAQWAALEALFPPKESSRF